MIWRFPDGELHLVTYTCMGFGQYSRAGLGKQRYHALYDLVFISKKPDTKDHVLYDFTAMKYPEYTNPASQCLLRWGWGGVGVEGMGRKDCFGVKSVGGDGCRTLLMYSMPLHCIL